MKKLEDISKKDIFTVPDGYFDMLPTIIQTRIANKEGVKDSRPYFKVALRYGLPLVIVLMGGIFWLNKSALPSQPESILASVQTEDLIAYLNDSEITTDDLLDVVNFDVTDLNEIEEEVYQLNINDKDFTDALKRD